MSTTPAAITWRLIEHDRSGARWNMAVDEAILEAVGLGISPPTVRFYRWESAAITIGRFQDVGRGIDLAACERLGIQVVRRPTGGRAVLHEEDETVAIVAPLNLLGSGSAGVARSYGMLLAGFRAALARLGVPTQGGGRERRSYRGADCFGIRTPADLATDRGEKILGSAQRRRDGIVLQQTSVRHNPGTTDPALVFVGPTEIGTYPLAAVLQEDLRQAFRDGFEAALGMRLEPGELSAWERERAGALMAGSAAIRSVSSEEREIRIS